METRLVSPRVGKRDQQILASPLQSSSCRSWSLKPALRREFQLKRVLSHLFSYT